MSTIRAAVYTRAGELEVEELELVAPGPCDVVVRVGASGLCHSDLSVLNGSAPLPPPLILGHEGAGTVEWVGADVSRVAVGDRVIASLAPVCGACWHCDLGESHLCVAIGGLMGIPRAHRADGGPISGLAALGTFAEAMVVSEMSVLAVRTEVPDEQLALLGCGVSTGLGAVLNTAQPAAGSTVAIIGCGGVGMAAVQGARLAKATRIIAIDPVPEKRAAALRLGATDVVDPGDGDPIEQVQALTGGRGVDFAFEAVGAVPLIEQAIAIARRGGTTVLIGAPRYDDLVSVSPMQLVLDGRTLKGSFYGGTRVERDIPRYVELVESGALDIGALIGARIDLDTIPTALPRIGGAETRTVAVF